MYDGVVAEECSAALLGWYDRHARVLPWRVSPQDRAAGVMPDPYRVWLSEIMLQQTTVAAVRSYFLAFTECWPTVEALAAADDDAVMAAWAGLGYYARARNLLNCARVLTDQHGGIFPVTVDELKALPGIGPYTAGAIAAIAFDVPAVVVDGNVERVMARLFAVETPLPTAKKELTALAERLTPGERAGDYAQAVMDLGATICTPRNPACGICPLRDPSKARAAGTAAELPRKLPKAKKPTRRGFAYVALRPDGAVLLERRPENGLLGGMTGFPGSDWSDAPTPAPPFAADWQASGTEVRHTFTHFHLTLDVLVAEARADAVPDTGEFRALDPEVLPTVMKKVWRAARSALLPD